MLDGDGKQKQKYRQCNSIQEHVVLNNIPWSLEVERPFVYLHNYKYMAGKYTLVYKEGIHEPL